MIHYYQSPRLSALSRFILLFLFSLGTVLWQTGCLKKPALPVNNPGRVDLRIYQAESLFKSSIHNLCQILIELRNKKANLTRTVSIDLLTNPFEEGSVTTSIPHLYPGIWEIDVYGLDTKEAPLFRGGNEVQIEPGETKQVSIYLVAGPGKLNLTVDASQIPGFGDTVNSGRLYVYLNPESGQSTSFPLAPDGMALKGEASLEHGTYSFKVAVPQVTGAIYCSAYYRVDIEAGQTTYCIIRPDGLLELISIIDSTPATPTGLALDRQGLTVVLTWNEVDETDLAGYYVYRTNNEGRFVRISETPAPSYSETLKESDFFQQKLGYAVSSYDQGGNESLWTPSLYLFLE